MIIARARFRGKAESGKSSIGFVGAVFDGQTPPTAISDCVMSDEN